MFHLGYAYGSGDNGKNGFSLDRSFATREQLEVYLKKTKFAGQVVTLDTDEKRIRVVVEGEATNYVAVESKQEDTYVAVWPSGRSANHKVATGDFASVKAAVRKAMDKEYPDALKSVYYTKVKDHWSVTFVLKEGVGRLPSGIFIYKV